jgi:hypothetical protein
MPHEDRVLQAIAVLCLAGIAVVIVILGALAYLLTNHHG